MSDSSGYLVFSGLGDSNGLLDEKIRWMSDGDGQLDWDDWAG